jgi:superfamily I DNA/RNA helicase
MEPPAPRRSRLLRLRFRPRRYQIDSLPEGDQAEALQRERSLLYVAATRARDELVNIHSGEPSELLPK